VLVDDMLGKSLASLSGLRMTPTRRRHLRGIGTVNPSQLSRATGGRRAIHREALQ
jgi:hypothetical protein